MRWSEIRIDIRIPVLADKEKLVQTLTNKASDYRLVYEEFDYLAPLYVPKDSFLVSTLMNIYKELTGDKYYVIEVSPAVHHTMGGVRINANAEVLGKNGRPIKGLYAAGEVTGGIHGANRIGGNAVADITIFGKIAGENAATFSKSVK